MVNISGAMLWIRLRSVVQFMKDNFTKKIEFKIDFDIFLTQRVLPKVPMKNNYSYELSALYPCLSEDSYSNTV